MSALAYLRRYTTVDCDTLHVDEIRKHGPFVDCTSNQAIAYNQLLQDIHGHLHNAVKAALDLQTKHEYYAQVKAELLTVEIVMILLSKTVRGSLDPTGFSHVQVNPFDVQSTERIVAGARRLARLWKELTPEDPSIRNRICIKIPSSWAGLRACEILQRDLDIQTLATTLFSVAQAVVAGHARCRYVAPYMHGLKDVMSANLRTDDVSKAELQRMKEVVVRSQRYYDASLDGIPTKVLPAALMSVDECLELRGVHHMTLPPRRIEELSAMKASDVKVLSMFEAATAGPLSQPPEPLRDAAKDMMQDEEVFNRTMKEWDGEMPAKLMDEAIEIFCDMQTRLEAMAREELSEVKHELT